MYVIQAHVFFFYHLTFGHVFLIIRHLGWVWSFLIDLTTYDNGKR